MLKVAVLFRRLHIFFITSNKIPRLHIYMNNSVLDGIVKHRGLFLLYMLHVNMYMFTTTCTAVPELNTKKIGYILFWDHNFKMNANWSMACLAWDLSARHSCIMVARISAHQIVKSLRHVQVSLVLWPQAIHRSCLAESRMHTSQVIPCSFTQCSFTFLRGQATISYTKFDKLGSLLSLALHLSHLFFPIIPF